MLPHPSLGTNNWDEASPLLARDIPKKSLKQKYLELNNIQTADEIFIAEDDEFIFSPQVEAKARDIPKESLEQEYLKLNSIQTSDEIFIAEEDEFGFSPQVEAKAPKTAPHTIQRRRGILLRFIRPEKENTTSLGSKSKRRRWLPKFDHKRRWPQGWCLPQTEANAPKTVPRPTQRRGGNSRRGILLRFIWTEKEKTISLGSKSKRRRWLPEFDHKRRWPQGWCLSQVEANAPKTAPRPTQRRRGIRRRGILLRFIWPEREKTTSLGCRSKRRRWLPKFDHKSRWPQGWC